MHPQSISVFLLFSFPKAGTYVLTSVYIASILRVLVFNADQIAVRNYFASVVSTL